MRTRAGQACDFSHQRSNRVEVMQRVGAPALMLSPACSSVLECSIRMLVKGGCSAGQSYLSMHRLIRLWLLCPFKGYSSPGCGVNASSAP